MAMSALTLAVVAASCSTSKTAKSDPKQPVVLEYRFADGSEYSYAQTGTSEQYMDVQGQSVAVSTGSYMGFTMKNLKAVQQQFEFDVVMDSLSLNVASPMMDNAGSMGSEVKGRSFRMSLSNNGKPLSMGDASKIQVGNPMSGGGDLGATFSEIFPKLPLKEVSPGQTWAMSDTTEVKSSAMESTTISKGDYTFTGYETVSGRKCVLITGTAEGSRYGKMNTQGMDMVMTIPFKGTEKIWFDPSAGIVVKYESVMSGTGQIEVVGMGMTLDLSMSAKANLELLK